MSFIQRQGVFRSAILIGGFVLLATLGAATWAGAAGKSRKASPPLKKYQSYILVEARTGRVLKAENPGLRWPPASMVKMMLMLLTLEKIEAGEVSWDEMVTASARASKMGGSQVYLKENERFSLRELFKAVVIASANDASVAVAEHLAGSVEAFVLLMNRHAQELGMKDTEYHSVEGLPPGKGQKPDLSSARDLAVLARELVKYPGLLKISSVWRDTFRNGTFELVNTNRLIKMFRFADGLKTGYYREARFDMTATAKKDDLRLIAVLMGCRNGRERFREAARLLSEGFAMMRRVTLAGQGESQAVIGVEEGVEDRVHAVTARAAEVFVLRDEELKVEKEIKLPEAVKAPVTQEQALGEVVFRHAGRELDRVSLVAEHGIERAHWFWRLVGWRP